MTQFLLELRSEEVPARMQAGARRDLEKLFREQLAAAGVATGAITVWSTPRRLALIASDLPEATMSVSEEVKGPRTNAPEQALDGFLRKTGLTRDQLTQRDGVWFAVSEKPGRATRDVLAEAIPAVIRAFPWPKSQRWGAASIGTGSLRWVRPLSGIVAIFGQELVDCEIGDIRSGFATKGHRFHHPGEITIGSAADYRDKLRACHVIVDHAERESLIRDKAKAAAEAAGLSLVEDEGLVVENAGLTEWPVPLLGRFDEAFLEVPPEVIQLTARTNQKYFVCQKPFPFRGGVGVGLVADSPTPTPSPEEEGELANAFVCTANIEAIDGGEAIVAGNRKVLAARLSDARFFWEQDRKKTLAQHAEGLARITFHEKLGTVADKALRVAKLARWLVEEGIVKPSPLQGRGLGVGSVSQTLRQPDKPHPNPSPEGEGLSVAQLANQAEQAARLCKADLVTEMVGEFPELQGLMGGYYARAEGLPDAVADAIRDHYKPVGQGDEVPTAPVTVAVSLADKLDTLFGFFAIDEKPTGSKDPFALRRAAIGVLSLIVQNQLILQLNQISPSHLALLAKQIGQAVLGEAGEFGVANDVFEAWRDNRLFGFENDAPFIRNRDGGRILFSNQLAPAARFAIETHNEVMVTASDLLPFLANRLKVQQREAGVRHDLIDAVFALGGEDDLVRLLARVHALQAFVATQDGANLLAGYKRAANILKKEGFDASPPSPSGEGLGVGPVRQMRRQFDSPHPNPSPEGEGLYNHEPAEQALIDALAAAAPKASAAVEAEDFAGAMAALATLRAPIDAFFDTVTVNDADAQKRAARLSLLSRFRDAVHSVADFSKIEG